MATKKVKNNIDELGKIRAELKILKKKEEKLVSELKKDCEHGIIEGEKFKINFHEKENMGVTDLYSFYKKVSKLEKKKLFSMFSLKKKEAKEVLGKENFENLVEQIGEMSTTETIKVSLI